MTITAASDRAQLDLGFVRRGHRTVIERRLFAWPFVLTRGFYLDPDRPHCLSVIVQTGSGAVHGEDRLAQRIVLGPRAAVCVTNQGATSVHRADAAVRAVDTVHLLVGDGSSLEFLPEPRILFPDAALSQQVELDCDDQGCALIVDAFTMHDPEQRGHSFRELESTFCLRRSSGEVVLLDRMRLVRPEPDIFRGYRAFGSAYLALSSLLDLNSVQLQLSAAMGDIQGLYAAASLLPDQSGIGVRLAAPDLRQIRAAFESIQAIYRRVLPAG